MITTPVTQALYIRKLNGLGEKISVQDSICVRQLKQRVGKLKSLQSVGLNRREFSLIYKGRNIGDKPQCTLKQLQIPSDGIVHVVFVSEEKNSLKNNSLGLGSFNELGKVVSSFTSKHQQQIKLRVIFNFTQHQLLCNLSSTVLQLKKRIAIKLNLVYQSLILSHLGTQMLDEKQLNYYQLQNQTLVSLKFNLHKPQKKKLQTRMVSSVTLSDQNNQTTTNQQTNIQLTDDKKQHKNIQIDNSRTKLPTSSQFIYSLNKQEQQHQYIRRPMKLTSLFNNKQTNMYKSQITPFSQTNPTNIKHTDSIDFEPNASNNFTSKAALLFKNALHQKITETQSVVSETFSQDTSFSGCDPNALLITVKNEQQTKEYVFECNKSHQIVNIKEKLLQVQRIPQSEKLEISMEEDLFQSIDLNKSGCITLGDIVRKMGKERAIFIYRII